MKASKLKIFLKGEYSALAVFIAMVIPVMIHTKSLLLKITNVESSAFELELYAWFFAAAFDCSIFMFAVDGKKKASAYFALMCFVVGFMFWNMDILFIEFWAVDANPGALWARLIIGTLWSGFSAYLLFYTAELFAERMNRKEESQAVVEAARPLRNRPSVSPALSAPRPDQGAQVNGNHKDAAPKARPTKAKAKRAEKINQVKELMNQGFNIDQIVNETGFSRTMVYEYQKA